MGVYDEIKGGKKGGEFTTNERQREVNEKVKGGNGEENYEAENGAEKPKKDKKRRTEEKNAKRKIPIGIPKKQIIFIMLNNLPYFSVVS